MVAARGLYSAGRKGLGDALLRHYGSIERDCPARGDDLRAQWTGCGRIDEAGITGVFDAMNDGGIAVVAVGEGGFPFDAPVWTRVAAGY